MQRILGINEDCSSSDKSVIGQSGVLAYSSSDEDHPVVLAPLDVADLLAGLTRAISGHRPGVDDSCMDPLVQKVSKSRRQRRKNSNIVRARVHEPQNSTRSSITTGQRCKGRKKLYSVLGCRLTTTILMMLILMMPSSTVVRILYP